MRWLWLLALLATLGAAPAAEQSGAEAPGRASALSAGPEDRIVPNPVSGDAILAGKLAIALGCAAALLVLLGHPRPLQVSDRAFGWAALGLLLASRIGLFALLYLVLDFSVTGDVPRYYAEGTWVAGGEVPNRDFLTSYALLFPYAVAAILALWDAREAIVLFAICVEGAVLPVWLAVARRFFDERVARRATLLYVTSPIPLLTVAMNGQNQVWVSLPLAGALLLLARRDIASGVLVGASVAVVKILGGVFAPVVWLFAEGRARWAAGFGAVTLAVYGSWYGLAGPGLLAGLGFESERHTSGNVYYLASAFGLPLDAPATSWVAIALLLVALAAVYLGAWSRGVRVARRNVVHLCTLVLLTLLGFAFKSYTFYLVMGFFAVCLSVAAGPLPAWQRWAFAGFGIIAVLEPGLWARWALKHDLSLLWAAALPPDVLRWKLGLFALCELALLVSYAALFASAWRRITER